jgi:uncharacterized protein (UPF0335 family)
MFSGVIAEVKSLCIGSLAEVERNQTKMNGIAANQLRTIIEKIEGLEADKMVVSESIKAVYAEASGNGFDKKTVRRMIKLRGMSIEQRLEQDSLEWIYRASLGMLDGASLPEFALERLSRADQRRNGQRGLFDQEPAPSETKPAEEATPPKQPEPDTDAKAPETAVPERTVEEAREMGRKAATDGRPVTDNPFPARDPRRAAFDEEWCKAAGSDGMEIPEAWRRTAKKKKEDPDGDDGKNGE